MLYTIGHSTRTIEEFIEILAAHGVRLLVDVRTVPRSRRVPHFNEDELPRHLKKAGIAYLHMKELGGLRKARKDSPNIGWRNESFRGYADYMGTEEFLAAMDRLEELASEQPTAIMCAEAVPWRCHRSLIADAITLLKKGEVRHIMSAKTANLHKPTPFVKNRGKLLEYPEATP